MQKMASWQLALRRAPRRGVEPRPAASNAAMLPSHSRGTCSTTSTRNIPTWNRTRTWSFGDSDANPLQRADADSTSIILFTDGAFLRRKTSTSARSRTPWGGFGGRLLTQEHTRKKPTDRCPWAYGTLTLQRDVPVRLADELRPAFHADAAAGVERLPGRPDRCPAELHACLCGVRSAFPLLQSIHASTQFSHDETPPCDRGTRGRSSALRRPAASRRTGRSNDRA